MKDRNLNNWKIDRDHLNIIWLTLDCKHAAVNSLNEEVLTEFAKILKDLSESLESSAAKEKNISGLVIQSAKKDNFIVGADINNIAKIKTESDALLLIKKGQEILNQLENLKFPTIALIRGFCLGGGLELSLACNYRIAIEHENSKLGLPEVMLGIHPGWGGTIRLPRIIGPLKAMDLILSGRVLSARSALKMGVVDNLIPQRHFIKAVEYFITKKPSVKIGGPIDNLIQSNLLRPLVGKFLKKKLSAKVRKDHYPAPYAVIDNWVKYNINDTDSKAMEQEAISTAKLIMTSTAKNLVRVFFLKERLKGLAKGEKNEQSSGFNPSHIHVIGAGTMGSDIAIWCALKGFKVTLQDNDMDALARATSKANSFFNKKLKLNHLVTASKDRLIIDPDGKALTEADVIIEAVFENKLIKQEIFRKIEQAAKPEAILATNTSTITLDIIREKMQKGELKKNVIGIHFFNPVSKMPLVEIVSDDVTSPDVLNNTISLAAKIGKLPLPVKSSPGFLINRMLIPYFEESLIMLEEGISPQLIDQAAKEIGMPMGPIELADVVGLDVLKSAIESFEVKSSNVAKIMAPIEKLVGEGKLGKKSGEGFYKYKNGKLVQEKIDITYKTTDKTPDEIKDISERPILRMLIEAEACLKENIVSDADLLDAGMIFGTGFIPFSGGPMNYIAEIGQENLKIRLKKLENMYGSRFNY